MKQLRLFIIVFCLAISIPMAYVIWQTYTRMVQEEKAQLSYFSETLFDEMEKFLAELIRNEEQRAVEEYYHTLAREGSDARRSPLARMPEQPYILGYFQNNPDGSFQTPLVADIKQVPEDKRPLIDELAKINSVFNLKKFSIPASPPELEAAPAMPLIVDEKNNDKAGLADRYISKTTRKAPKTYLGEKKVQTQEITAQQALNIITEDQRRQVRQEDAGPFSSLFNSDGTTTRDPAENWASGNVRRSDYGDIRHEDGNRLPDAAMSRRFQVEVAPFQSVFITADEVFIFRRIAISNQIYRQGFVIDVPEFLNYLADNQFKTQPLADFMTLRMQTMGPDNKKNVIQVGPAAGMPKFFAQRRFPAPFSLFSASLQARAIPTSPARGPLNAALAILGTVMVFGLLAIYKSTRTVVDMSERRSQFVSSVTHELKTPLTNIRMYIEMIEQGIAATPEREQEYLHVLDAESARLSRLINNVLELAKLEKKQRRFQYQEGELADVFAEVNLIMSQKLKQEGFSLTIDTGQVPAFAFDREVLIQLLVNLIENSIKFGKQSQDRHLALSAGLQGDDVRIALADTGPGIPRKALRKVFDDFFRVDNELTRTTGGTGIGLALVKKFVDAMGGKVWAANNTGPGCTISILLPQSPGR